MRAARVLVVGALVLLSGGCAYFNSLYNAKRSFREAETDRWNGQGGVAAAKYQGVIERAARSLQIDDDGRWADDALLLIGRAHARRGNWPEAEAALRRAVAMQGDDASNSGARAYLGMAAIARGDNAAGIALIDEALEGLEDASIQGEAYLWQAQARFQIGATEAAWRGLDAAAEQGARYRVLAEFRRLQWGIDNGDTVQAFQGVGRLMREGSVRWLADSIGGVVDVAARIWGADMAVRLLEGVADAPWLPAQRNSLLLRRADFLAATGDLEAAMVDANRVARGVGRRADDARVRMARWRLVRIETVGELEEVRALLLPAVGSQDALGLLEGIKKIGLMVERAGTERQPLSLFAAAEMARDTLIADRLAYELFMVYVGEGSQEVWAAKALMAARDLASGPDQLADIERRLEGYPDNVYVLAANGGDYRERVYQSLEGRLRSTLASIRQEVASQAQFRDVLVSQIARQLDSIRRREEFNRRLAEGDSTLLDSIRLDSIMQDSLRLDSILRDSLGDTLSGFATPRDTVPWARLSSILPWLESMEVRRLRSVRLIVPSKEAPRATPAPRAPAVAAGAGLDAVGAGERP